MGLEDIQRKFKEIVDDGLLNGFTIEHYKKLKNLLNEIDVIECSKNKEFHDMYLRVENIIRTLYEYGLLHSITKKNIYYIRENASLLPLVLANNNYEGRIKMYCNNSYMFLCQFHREKTPSFGVTDQLNLCHCFGCGMSGTVFDYLQAYENLTFKETIQLLSQIYLYDVKKHDSRLDQLTKKYQDTITSDLYMDLLEMGKKRLETRNLRFYDNKYYDEKYEMIDRIKKQEYDPNFEYKEPEKRIYLEIRPDGYIYQKRD